MDNSLILLVVFGIRKRWKHLYKVLHCVFCFGPVLFLFFFNEENIIFSALHFNGYGTRLKNYLVVGYVEPPKFNKFMLSLPVIKWIKIGTASLCTVGSLSKHDGDGSENVI